MKLLNIILLVFLFGLVMSYPSDKGDDTKKETPTSESDTKKETRTSESEAKAEAKTPDSETKSESKTSTTESKQKTQSNKSGGSGGGLLYITKLVDQFRSLLGGSKSR